MLTLHHIAGPPLPTISISPDRPARIGRLPDCEVRLPHEQVSRQHATIVRRGSGWFVVHASSRSPTLVNGVQLDRGRPTPLESGDALRIGPWTLRVLLGDSVVSAAATVDDTASSTQTVERLSIQPAALQSARLRLLMECLSRLAGTEDRAALTRIALESATVGSGFARGAILRVRSSPDDVEVIGTIGVGIGVGNRGSPLSKSLLMQASTGQPVALSIRASAAAAPSVSDAGLHAALCTPIMLGEDVFGFLYLDARRDEQISQLDASGAAAFCDAVAAAYGLAIAASRRAELYRRQHEMETEFAIAREIQERLAPPRELRVGHTDVAGVSEAGLFVGGDLVLVASLDDGRTALCIGDAAGHGVAASLLMASTHAHLYAELQRTGDPRRSVASTNVYLAKHAAAGRFVSLWVGVLDADGNIEYVDAGHGYAGIVDDRGGFTPFGEPSGPPIGVVPEFEYRAERARLLPGQRLLLYTDGIIDQRGGSGEAFGLDRLRQTIAPRAEPRRCVEGLIAEVRAFAGQDQLEDDASAVCVRLVTA